MNYLWRKYDSLPEPRRFIVFFLPFLILFGLLIGAKFVALQIAAAVVLILAMYSRVNYLIQKRIENDPPPSPSSYDDSDDYSDAYDEWEQRNKKK